MHMKQSLYWKEDCLDLVTVCLCTDCTIINFMYRNLNFHGD